MKVAVVENGVINYIHNNYLGVPAVITDSSGAVVWEGDYKPFGEMYDVNGTLSNNIRFPGQYQNEESGYSYNYFRDYDPTIGRYLQSDPIGLNGGINTYGYVGGNPINRTDRYGLACDQNGCWVTPEEQKYADSGDYNSYYQTACKGGDSYACMAQKVANNDGFLAAATNTRLANSIADNLPNGMSCKESREKTEEKMNAIRIALAKDHAEALNKKSASPSNPVILERQDISDFHNKIFQTNGADRVFGGDIPVFGNWPFKWCSAPSCAP